MMSTSASHATIAYTMNGLTTQNITATAARAAIAWLASTAISTMTATTKNADHASSGSILRS